MRKFKNNNRYKGQHKNYKQDRPPRKSRPQVNPNDLHPSKVDTSESLLNSFTHRTVKRRMSESNEALIKRFKSVVEKAGVLSEIKKREHYKSKGEKKREKILKARKRARKKENMRSKRRFNQK